MIANFNLPKYTTLMETLNRSKEGISNFEDIISHLTYIFQEIKPIWQFEKVAKDLPKQPPFAICSK